MLITLFSKIFKKRRHQSDSMCQLPPNEAKYGEKKRTVFLTPTVSKKSQNCEIWRQKSKSGNPGKPRWPAGSFSFADL